MQYTSVLTLCDSSYRKGKQLIAVLACVNIIEGMTGGDQLTEATKMHDKYASGTETDVSMSLPLVLLKELESVIQAHGKPTKRRKIGTK